MTIFKTIAKKLYELTHSQLERETSVLEALTEEQRESIANLFLRREAPRLSKGTPSYNRVLQSTEDFVIIHHGATSFAQMCRSHVRRNSGENYYLLSSIGKILQDSKANEGKEVKGGEAKVLLDAIQEDLQMALALRNPIKRRSVVRSAIKEHVGELPSDKLDYLVEAVIQAA